MSYNNVSMSFRHIKTSFLFILLAVLLLSACGGKGRYRWSKHRLPPTKVKFVMNDRVRAWLDYYRGPGKARFTRHLRRSGKYIPLMQSILREYGIPDEVVYISLIESGFQSKARSYANAVGFWQFIESTGKHFDLRIDPYVDERMDFIKATHAAARYFVHLYEMFGDWHLAFIAYNAGEGKVKRAISKYDTDNIWKLTSNRKRYFKSEQKDYVPKYLAAAMIAMNPRKYGFRVRYEDPVSYDLVKVNSQTDFETVAKCSRADFSEIADLNAELKMGVTPPDKRHYKIKVPKGRGKRFVRTFAKLPRHERLVRKYKILPAYHVVRRGETPLRIARKYKVSTRSLLKTNKIRNPRHLRIGQKLKIPGRTVKTLMTASKEAPAIKTASKSSKEISKKSGTIKYKIRRGDTIGTIAHKYNVSTRDLKKWNKLRSNRIIAGRRLKIYKGTAPKIDNQLESSKPDFKIVEKNYKIKRGDTLFNIAKKHSTTVAKLKSLNNLRTNTIGVGKSLIISRNKVAVPTEKIASDNSRSATVHHVKKGDSWWSIARKNNLTVTDLKKLNPKVGKILKIGQKLNLKETSDDQKVRYAYKKGSDKKVPTSSTYTVRNGDTLYAIARRNKISLAELCRINSISRKALIKPGMKLKLSGFGKGVPDITRKQQVVLSSASDGADKNTISYKVKSGDTAWNIARKHNVSLSDIKNWNQKRDLTKLRPGDIIRLEIANRDG